jgi:Asp-tRNA(Asn)/Glu-tRNA(Gln) amidotransferase A subunit family amidase
LEQTFRSRDKPTARDSEEARAAWARRDVVRALVSRAMDERRLDALAYPPMQQTPALIGEPQLGIPNCQLAPSCGFPAICVPAGFTAGGVPIGIELLGRAWDEPKLLAMAFAYEQVIHPRIPPPLLPPLPRSA